MLLLGGRCVCEREEWPECGRRGLPATSVERVGASSLSSSAEEEKSDEEERKSPFG